MDSKEADSEELERAQLERREMERIRKALKVGRDQDVIRALERLLAEAKALGVELE